MWDLSWTGIKLTSPALAGFFTTEPPGKPDKFVFERDFHQVQNSRLAGFHTPALPLLLECYKDVVPLSSHSYPFLMSFWCNPFACFSVCKYLFPPLFDFKIFFSQLVLSNLIMMYLGIFFIFLYLGLVEILGILSLWFSLNLKKYWPLFL